MLQTSIGAALETRLANAWLPLWQAFGIADSRHLAHRDRELRNHEIASPARIPGVIVE